MTDMSAPLPAFRFDGETWEPVLLRGDVSEKAHVKAMTTAQLVQVLKALSTEQLRAILPALPLLGDSIREEKARADRAEQRVRELDALINRPQTADFLEAVRTEAAHQVERWGTEHDEGKGPTDWFWLLGYLGGKAVWSATHGDREKALHHVITTAAACLNWHAQLSGNATGMRPGIATPAGELEPK